MKTTIALILTMSALMSGCYSAPEMPCSHGQEMQCELEQIVWRDVYHDETDPPSFEWMSPIYDSSGVKVNGLYMEAIDLARGEWTGVWNESSAYVYAHELLHAHLFRINGDGNQSHDRPEWKTLLPIAKDKALEYVAQHTKLAPLPFASFSPPEDHSDYPR